VPGAGSVAALVAAMAAALIAKAARVSQEGWPDAAGIVAQAESLRARAAPLAERDAEVYRAALDAMRSSGHDATIANELDRAAEIPLEIAAIAVDVAALAEIVAERGNEAVHGESAGAAALAGTAARIAAHLVEINLTAAPSDERVERAQRLAAEAGDSARRALRPA
jgi:formiminotetrahydrofolate cyclodeaminase